MTSRTRGGRETGERLTAFYDALFESFGPQGWWPGRTRFEVIVGAILTQNTSWSNVERAIGNLRAGRLLNPEKLHALDLKELSGLIRPAGYFNVKAGRLKNFLDFLFSKYGGSISRLFNKKGEGTRGELLAVVGIGPETADSILLYAGGRPEFVVDAYTRRVFSRHGLVGPVASYDEVKSLFMENLEPDSKVFNEYHALIVRVGKHYCKPREPMCSRCPLEEFLS